VRTIGAIDASRDDVVVVNLNRKGNDDMKTKAAKKATRKAINYAKLAAMWIAGKSYEEMGKALGMKGNEKNDPYKPVRAAISNMLNGKATAWKDKNEKVLTLASREGMRAIGKGKKAPKAKSSKKAVKKVVSIKKGQPKKATPQIDGKTLAAGGQ
jgi:hypothetical protein